MQVVLLLPRVEQASPSVGHRIDGMMALKKGPWGVEAVRMLLLNTISNVICPVLDRAVQVMTALILRITALENA
jgi:hypothetical protein